MKQFVRVPQGYKNSPGIFQKAMLLVIRLSGGNLFVYIDDVLTFGKTEQEHDGNLSKVKERLELYGLVENTL